MRSSSRRKDLLGAIIAKEEITLFRCKELCHTLVDLSGKGRKAKLVLTRIEKSRRVWLERNDFLKRDICFAINEMPKQKGKYLSI